MQSLMFDDAMGYTIGPLVVSLLQEREIDAAHAVLHPVSGGSRLTIYKNLTLPQARELVRDVLQDLHRRIEARVADNRESAPRARRASTRLCEKKVKR